MFLTTIPVQLEIKIKVRADRDTTAVVEPSYLEGPLYMKTTVSTFFWPEM